MADGRRHAPAMKVVSLLPRWHARLEARLGDQFRVASVDPDDRVQLATELRDADVVVAFQFPAEFAALAPALRLLISPAAGTENIARHALPSEVVVLSSAGQEQPIAEYVLGTLVALRHRLFESDRKLRMGEWTYGYFASNFVDELYASSIGMIGYGRIGKEVSLRAAAFGMRCSALTLHPQRAAPPSGVRCELGALTDSAIDALMARSDAVVVCCELSDITRGLLDGRRLRLMKQHAVLINIARGPIVVERDLYEVLREKRIAGAALDVWYNYPPAHGQQSFPSSYPFADLDNIIMTPHCSGWTVAGLERRLDSIARAIEEFAKARS